MPDGPGQFHFRYWSPAAREIAVTIGGESHALTPGDDGMFEGTLAAAPGDTYALQIDGKPFPDPASRLQAGDVHGEAVLCDGAFDWRHPMPDVDFQDMVFLELHVGTFTPEGTYAAAIERLPYLRDLGFTAIELMPVGDFAGTRGWGYDAVLPYAPHAAYGTPDDLRRLVDAAHGLGLAVYLDVIYNHFGPEGNYLPAWCPDFFDADLHTPWGAAIDYSRQPVRDFAIDNAIYWLEQFRFDGLRLDAVDHIRDTVEPELLAELARRVRAAVPHPVMLMTEDDRNITRLHGQGEGLFDGEWNDDYHHVVHCLLTGESDHYYEPYSVDPMGDLVMSLRDGFVDQGQPRPHRDFLRGEPSGHLPPQTFVTFNQNHDQIGNRPFGSRLRTLASPDACRVADALLLLSPFTPLMFMGEEYGERAPFQFFTDFHGELADAVREGRRREFGAFREFAQDDVPDPNNIATFERSRLTWPETEEADDWRDLTRTLLALRREHVVPLRRTGRTAPAEVERTGPRAVRATWTFAGGTLTLAATFGDTEGGVDDPDEFLTLGRPGHDPWSLTASVALR